MMPGGVLLGILGGAVPPQILTLFQTKQCHFPHLFSDQTSKIHTPFQTWPLLVSNKAKGHNGT